MKNNRLLSILLCILILLSGANLLVGISNTVRINQLEDAPAVVIEKIDKEDEVTTAEKPTLTFKNDTTTTEPFTTTTAPSPESESISGTTTETTSVTAPSQQESSSVCYVTASGTKYHRDGCSYLKKSKTKMTVQEAKDCGYTPCSRCF